MLYSRSRYLKTECNISNLFCAVLTFKIKCQKKIYQKNFLKAYVFLQYLLDLSQFLLDPVHMYTMNSLIQFQTRGKQYKCTQQEKYST